jgi:hypothetical protein
VTEINANDGVSISLTSVITFGSTNVTLTSGTNTNYTCSYDSGHYSVLNITGSKLFTIQGGILKYGNMNLNYYFIIVNSTCGSASLCLLGVEIEFVSAMNSTVFILGGKISLEDVKINNQLDTNWVSPLVFSYSKISSVTVNLHSCTITNSKYKNADSFFNRSAVVYFISFTNATHPIIFNMSFCLCLNNTFSISNVSWGGGFSLLYSKSTSSSMLFFLIRKTKQ